MKIFRLIKRFFFRLWFKLFKSEYMRVAYLNPRQVVLITTRLNGKDNVIPIDWHMPLSYSPKLYAISLEKKNHTSSIIQQTKCFAVNFMSSEFEEQILKSGRVSGSVTDKFELLKLRQKEASKIDVPLLEDAVGYLECRVTETTDAGDHIVFIAEVVNEKLITENINQIYHITAV